MLSAADPSQQNFGSDLEYSGPKVFDTDGIPVNFLLKELNWTKICRQQK